VYRMTFQPGMERLPDLRDRAVALIHRHREPSA
jgi:hypothetical protein